MEINKIKINLFNSLIDRNIDKTMVLIKECRKNNIRLNEKDNIIVKKIEELDIKTMALEDKMDNIIEKMRKETQNNFNKSLEKLYNEYSNKKYKIKDIKTGDIFYTNDIKGYIRNFNYEIYCIIENMERRKQCCYEYIDFKDNDTKFRKDKRELYNKSNEMIELYFECNKKGSSVVYNKIYNNVFLSVNGVNIFKVNKNSLELEKINKAIDSFENNNEVQELFSKYNKDIFKREKEVKITIQDRFKKLLAAYDEGVNKHQDLKHLMDNKEVLMDFGKYNNKDGVYLFYKEFKINKDNWTNYISNYSRLQYLKSIDIKNIEKASKDDDRFWRSPEKVLRWNDFSNKN